MTPDNEFFTPEEVDEQIASLSRNPHGTETQEVRVIEDLQHFYAKTPEHHTRVIAQAWERIVEEYQMAKRTSPEKGRNISMQDSQGEQPILNGKPATRKSRTVVQQLSLLAAIVVIGVLVGCMAFVLNMARQSKGGAKPSSQVASGGTPAPKPLHPIVGGACTIDTTVAHPRESKSDLPGLYVFAYNSGQGDNVLYRYNPQTKVVVWSKKLCGMFEPSGVIAQNGILYLAGTDWTNTATSGSISYLYALNEADGSALWGVQFPTDLLPMPTSSPNYGSTPTDLGMIEAPTVTNGIVYVVQRSGIVYAYNAVTGAQLWTFNTGRNAWATTSEGNGSILDPSSIQVINGVAYGSIVDRVFALDAKSGTKIWMHSFDNALNINRAPAVANGTLYLTAFVPGYGHVTNPDTYIYAFDAHTGTQKWVSAKMRGYLYNPTLVNGGVYVMSYDNAWYTLNTSSGVIEAQKTLPADSGPLVVNGIVYNSTNTVVEVLNPDGSTKWSAPITGEYPVLAAVQGGIIYITTRDRGVYAYSATNGALLWHYAGYLPQPDSNWWMTVVS